MLRIGIVGTENSHADHFVRHLNIDQHRQDARVVALAGGDTERNRTLADQGGIDTVTGSLAEVMDQIDAAVVCNRHGGLHREHAVPLLEAGKHVFVDKPTSTTVADTEAMIKAAQAGGGVLASWSILRHAPGILDLRKAAGELGESSVVTVLGPADPDDPHAGLFFYGPHVVEAALELLGNPELDGGVSVHTVKDGVVATAQAGGTQLVLVFIRRADGGRVPWHATVAGPNGVAHREITSDTLAHGTGLDRFLDAALAGQAPAPYAELVTPVRLLTAITEQL
ncbi:Gfo/Idh/MocA family oxidoreductase [Phytoactinopolyspora alkaliphila]|uniref:Gfo/Idh/MocA family oxidoreductase n=1 Tax=Phytoactinopolyspora alkaliphila TaxID=1783498 RepID=A0A6N9YLG5_9ACTN|nr:Gfo/Idh/MocA family oxidoreductase [Phytoactinopolyspora alkaliphila]